MKHPKRKFPIGQTVYVRNRYPDDETKPFAKRKVIGYHFGGILLDKPVIFNKDTVIGRFDEDIMCRPAKPDDLILPNELPKRIKAGKTDPEYAEMFSECIGIEII